MTSAHLPGGDDGYRALTQAASDAIITIDSESVILSVNPATERIFGYTAEELIGRSLTVLMPEHLREAHRRGIQRYLEAGERAIRWDGIALPALHKSGREIPTEISFGCFERDGATVFIGIVRDVSERVAQQRALEETATELEVAIEDLRTRTAELEAAHRWTTFLADTSRILSSSLDDETTLTTVAQRVVPRLADWCFIDILQPDGSLRRLTVAHADPAQAELAERLRHASSPQMGSAHAVRTGEPELLEDIGEMPVEAITDDPEVQDDLRELAPESYLSVPLIARGHTLGALTLVFAGSGRRYEPSDLARAQELAARAAMAIDNARLYAESQEGNRAKSEFLAVISHELRTPLSGILGYTELLTDGIAGPLTGIQQGYLGRIRSGALHLVRLIEQLLSFSRVEAGREEVLREAVDAREVLQEAVEMIEPEISAAGLRLHVHLPERAIRLETDASKLRQIVANLLANAVKFTEEGEIRVDARQDSGTLVLTVSDTGIGIAPEHLELIFEPFRQVDQSMTRTAGGAGLGLSVTRRLARLLGGDVEVRSEPGRGSTFTVRLPIDAEVTAGPPPVG